ncbi:hypothetical protein [Rothia mucilaginosa]|uniref:hypothetical protein n=1 Tax=Rothia mucilaginosa TaxID=43675 RepID=UPI0028F0656A|nr:hypothetical protein [Rothia mucilaginosa]
MSENTPNNPSQGAAGGYGYDAGAHPAQGASLPGQAAQPGNAAQAAQPSQPVQPSQQGNAAQPAAPAAPQQPVQPQQAPQPTPASAHAQPNAEAQATPAQPGQPAAASQPGAAQPGVAPQPGQPGQATYAPSAPHPAVKALGATWNAFLDVFSSNPATAHARISSAGAWGWIVPTTLQALVGAFFFSQLVILAATVAMSMMGYMYGRGGAYGGAYAAQAVPTGRMILAYVLMALAIFGVQVLRGVQLQLTARIGKAPASFTASMHAVSVSSLALIPSFLVLNLLVFFMTLSRSGDGASFLTMLMVLVLAFAVFSGEALTYLGLNRLGRFAKSPIIMHAALSTAWVFASMIVYYVAIRLMGA